jgi:hypothetical protein
MQRPRRASQDLSDGCEVSRNSSSVRVAIVIPAFNEADQLPATLAGLPRTLDGVDSIDVIVIDDGSVDGSSEVARSYGAAYVLRHDRNRGLAHAFTSGLAVALTRGATHIVQTDADGQYEASDISKILLPVLRGEADLVVGARPIADIAHFSLAKRWFQRIGSWVVRIASGTEVLDAPSGFRAMTAQTARRLHVHNAFTYTLETLIQAGRSGMRVVSVPIRVNAPTRSSRLMRSWPVYVLRSAQTIVRIVVIYRPFRFFAGIGAVLLLCGTVLVARFVMLHFADQVQGNDPSLIVAGVLFTVGIQAVVAAFLADSIAAVRRLTQRVIELQLGEDFAGIVRRDG